MPPRNPRQFTRRWTITCANGMTMQTYPLTRGAAEEVTRFFDEHHPDCAPHVLESRETRKWAQRKEQAQ